MDVLRPSMALAATRAFSASTVRACWLAERMVNGSATAAVITPAIKATRQVTPTARLVSEPRGRFGGGSVDTGGGPVVTVVVAVKLAPPRERERRRSRWLLRGKECVVGHA